MGSILRDGFAFLLFQGCDHLPNAIMFAARCEDFQTFFIRAPLQDVDVHVADTPISHLRSAGFIQIDCAGPDQRVSVIVDNVFFVRFGEPEARSQRVA